MAPPAQWARRLLRRGAASTPRPPRASSHKRSRSLPPLSAVAGAGAAALLLSASPDTARHLRTTAQLGAMVFMERYELPTLDDAMQLARETGDLARRGGLRAVQDDLAVRLMRIILQLGDDEEGRQTLCSFVSRGAVALLVQYAACCRPAEPWKLQQLMQSLVKLLETAVDNEQVELRVSLLTLAQTLGHLTRQQAEAVTYVDLLQLGNALVKVQQLSNQRLEEGASGSRAFLVLRSELEDPDYSKIAGACEALVTLCSPEKPLALKKFGLWALSALLQKLNRVGNNAGGGLDAVLGPEFAEMLLALPRKNYDAELQLEAASVMDTLLHTARQNPSMVSHDTYELWMKQIRYWTGSAQNLHSATTVKRAWGGRGRFHKAGVDENERSDTGHQNRIQLKLQLASARCLRTLTASPKSRRYVCGSKETRAAIFGLATQIHEMKQHMGEVEDGDMSRCVVSIQRHLSWAFRNICEGYQDGAMAINCLFDSSWTASLLQSRRDLPMSRFFRGVNDLNDLPIIGAEDYDGSTEFGWVDILTAWSASTDHQVRENAISSLIYLAEQRNLPHAELTPEEKETLGKQEHILQAWLTSMLQQIRLLSGGELLAVKQMEEIAHVSEELTPGNERILFNPAVVDAGTSALAVLAEHHHSELVQQGVVPLVAMLSATSAATPAQHTQCARVLANLVATYCLNIDPRSSALNTDPTHAVIASDHVDIAKLLDQTTSGKRFLASIRCWRECTDPMQRSNYFRVLQNLRAYDEVVAGGHLVEDVYCEGVNPIVSRSGSFTSEQASGDTSIEPVVDVVFVHGLRGHPFGTWRTDMSNKLEGDNDVWPDVLLAKDLEDNDVPARLVTLGYEAGMVSWSSPWPSLTLQERARVMLSALYAANIGRDRRHPDAPARPVIFITHSMGGLLTKKMLLLEREQRERCRLPTLADSTTGVVFLAVPHFGSDLAKGVRSESIRRLIQTHPAIEDLGADPNGRLKTLNDNFKELSIDCLSVGEDRAAPVALGLSAVVVKPASADPGVGRFYVLPNSDHMTICKSKSRSEPLYQDILQYVIQHSR